MAFRPHRSPAATAHGDSRNRWLTIAALSALTLMIQGSTLMSLGVLLPAMAPGFGGHVGSGATGFLLAMSIASLAAGWALGRFGTRPVLLTGIACCAAGFALAALAQVQAALIAALALSGLGVGLSTIVPGIAIITRQHASRRGVALALFLSAAVMAGALLPPLVGEAVLLWSWRQAMLLCAAGLLLLCPPLLLLIPRGALPSEAAHRGRLRFDANILRVLLAMTLLQLSINGILFAAVDILMARGLSPLDAIFAYSAANLLGLPALLAGGVVADRLGARLSLMMTALMLAGGTAALLAVREPTLDGAALFVLLWGVASALPGQSGSMLLADVTDADAFPRMLGIDSAVIGLIGAAAPLLTDQMHLASQSHDLGIAFYAALALAAAPIIALIRPSQSKAG